MRYRYRGLTLLVLLLVKTVRSGEEEKSGKTNEKRGAHGYGDPEAFINNYGQSFHGHGPPVTPLSPLYTDFTTPSTIPAPVPLPVTLTVARPYPVNVPRPYPVNIPRPYPVNIPRPYPVNIPRPYPVNIPRPYPVTVPHIVPYGVPVPKPYPVPVHPPYPIQPPVYPVYPTYPPYGVGEAGLHGHWNFNKAYGGVSNALSSGFDVTAGTSSSYGYPHRGVAHGLPLGPPTVVSYATPYNSYAPSPSGVPASIPASKLSLLAAGLAAHPDIAIAAASAQHKHPQPIAYPGLPGGPTKTGLLAAGLAAYPDIAIAAAAAHNQHGQQNAYTGSALAAHPEIALAAFAAHNKFNTHAQMHQNAYTGSDFIAQLSGTHPNYETAAAAAHLGYGAHPTAQIGAGKVNNVFGFADYIALNKFAVLKGHGSYPDFHSIGHAGQRYARTSQR